MYIVYIYYIWLSVLISLESNREAYGYRKRPQVADRRSRYREFLLNMVTAINKQSRTFVQGCSQRN